MVAAVRVGERRWNLRLNNGADVLLPEGAEAPAMARLMELHTAQALLDRPVQALDLRLPDRLVVRPLPEPPLPVPPEGTADSAERVQEGSFPEGMAATSSPDGRNPSQ